MVRKKWIYCRNGYCENHFKETSHLRIRACLVAPCPYFIEAVSPINLQINVEILSLSLQCIHAYVNDGVGIFCLSPGKSATVFKKISSFNILPFLY